MVFCGTCNESSMGNDENLLLLTPQEEEKQNKKENCFSKLK